jgi:hypothetical protein
MPTHRLVLLFTLATLLGLVAVYLQVQRVQIGYKVSLAEARLERLRESVRDMEVSVHRRRDLAVLQGRAQAFGTALDVSAAGHVVRVAGRKVVAAPPAGGRPANAIAAR